MTELALFGGTPVLTESLRPYPSMGDAEIEEVIEVVRSGCLSGFYGSPGDEFFGGPKVRAFETAWGNRYQSRYAVSVNSATSGLCAAVGAIGVGPGDEVIVPPFTMSATVMAPLAYGGIPVFADIEDETFCIDPSAVRASITERTRAVLAVNLYGHPARLAELRRICDDHGLFLIEDNAQSPLAHEDGRHAGTIGHIGVFSLNYHKHIHTGEGGVCLTDDGDLAKRLQLIRNHGENAVEWLGMLDLSNMIGFNLRLTELQAAVGLAQLREIDRHVEARERAAARLTEAVADLEGLTPPKVRSGCRHNYYMWALRFNAEALGLRRETFARALTAEGFPNEVGYVRPLYLLPAFQKRMAIGRSGFPFTLTERRYEPGLCPVAERLHEREIILFQPCSWHLGEPELELLVEAIRKVHRSTDRLRTWERRNAST